MAQAPVNVRVGMDASATSEPGRATGGPSRAAAADRGRPPGPEQVPEQVEQEATVERDERGEPRRRPTMREIVERAAGLADVGSVAAENLGAEGAADAMRRTADVARKTVVAVEGVRREVEPVATAAKGLWKSLEDRGWVGVRKPINIAQMQGRDRRKPAKKEGE